MKLSLVLLLVAVTAQAELSITMLPLKITGQKVIVPLALRNDFSEKIESARGAVFLLDERGKRIAQGTRWIIGGNEARGGLAAGATNSFHFLVTADKPLTTTNLTAEIVITRVVLEGGKLASPAKGTQTK